MKHYINSTKVSCGNDTIRMRDCIRIENILDVTCPECKQGDLYRNDLKLLVDLGNRHLKCTYVPLSEETKEDIIEMKNNMIKIVSESFDSCTSDLESRYIKLGGEDETK